MTQTAGPCFNPNNVAMLLAFFLAGAVGGATLARREPLRATDLSPVPASVQLDAARSKEVRRLRGVVRHFKKELARVQDLAARFAGAIGRAEAVRIARREIGLKKARNARSMDVQLDLEEGRLYWHVNFFFNAGCFQHGWTIDAATGEIVGGVGGCY